MRYLCEWTLTVCEPITWTNRAGPMATQNTWRETWVQKTNPALNAVLFIKLIYTGKKVTSCLPRVLSNQDLRGLLKGQGGGFKPSFEASWVEIMMSNNEIWSHQSGSQFVNGEWIFVEISHLKWIKANFSISISWKIDVFYARKPCSCRIKQPRLIVYFTQTRPVLER